MKATGIVRRIDDLGRVAIPKEIRRTLGIQDSDPLEIFVGDGQIILRPYDSNRAMQGILKRLRSAVFDSDPVNLAQIVKKLDELRELIKAGEEPQ